MISAAEGALLGVAIGISLVSLVLIGRARRCGQS